MCLNGNTFVHKEVCTLPHTDVESIRAILKGDPNPSFRYSGMTPEEVKQRFGWPGLPKAEIERVVAISNQFGDECRDAIYSLVCYTKRLPQPKRHAVWQVLERYDSDRDGSPHPFIRRVYVEKLNWKPADFKRDKLPDDF